MSSAVIAMIGHHGWGGAPWWPLFPLLWFLLWVAVIVTVIVLWRRRRDHPTRSAQALLAEEFARGNITEEDYEQRLAALQRHKRT